MTVRTWKYITLISANVSAVFWRGAFIKQHQDSLFLWIGILNAGQESNLSVVNVFFYMGVKLGLSP